MSHRMESSGTNSILTLRESARSSAARPASLGRGSSDAFNSEHRVDTVHRRGSGEKQRTNAQPFGEAKRANAGCIWVKELKDEWARAYVQRQAEGRRREAERRALLRGLPFLSGDTEPPGAGRGIPVQLRGGLAAAHIRYSRVVRQISSMVRPVLATIALVCAYVVLIGSRQGPENKLIERHVLVYRESPGDSLARRLRGAFANAALVLSGVAGVTLVFVAVFAWRARRTAAVLLALILVFLLCVPWSYFGAQFIVLHGLWWVDAATFSLIVFNFSLGGFVILRESTMNRSFASRAITIALCMSLIWPFTEFAELTVWSTLLLLTAYDVFAVLAPCGPLRYIMERESRQTLLLPGLMYQGDFFRLGLGDFVFYGALVARAAAVGWRTAIACSVAVATGLVVTVVITRRARGLTAVPALPASVALGCLFYVAMPRLTNIAADALATIYYDPDNVSR